MKRILFLNLWLAFIAGSCDYQVDYFYYVDNRLDDTITVVIHSTGYRHPSQFADSVFVVKPREKLHIKTFGDFTTKKDNYAIDIMTEYEYNELGKIDVFRNGVKIEKNLWERQFWEFTSEVRKGTYVLVIDVELLKTNAGTYGRKPDDNGNVSNRQTANFSGTWIGANESTKLVISQNGDTVSGKIHTTSHGCEWDDPNCVEAVTGTVVDRVATITFYSVYEGENLNAKLQLLSSAKMEWTSIPSGHKTTLTKQE